MNQAHYALSWDLHKNSICNGLSSLQQNGEFVDMTLAADGHMVKVHQIVMALASPYIKELISSAQCPHPIIFLNKISYKTLCSILEYIYTGEVMVAKELLPELIQAGKELHVKGLNEMKLERNYSQEVTGHSTFVDSSNNDLTETFEISDTAMATEIDDDSFNNDDNDLQLNNDPKTNVEIATGSATTTESSNLELQYTLSTHGALQMILNRYIYYLKYSNKDNTRQWRCLDYLNSNKCPAYVVTKAGVVLQRVAAHVHPFHDDKILKKLRDNKVFAYIK